MKMIMTYIALGSNLNTPIEQIKRAVAALQQLPQSVLLATSSLYETAPLGITEQPNFINAVVSLQTALSPYTLLSKLQKLEKLQGRIHTAPRNSPRVLDLDILLYGNLEIDDEKLTIPHPQLNLRAFVLCPLAEIAPDLILPNGQSITELQKKCADQQCKILKDKLD